MSQAVAARPIADILKWPAAGISRVPLQVFSDPELYAWEQDLIFRGPTWHYLGLEAEIPTAGEYMTTHVGDTPIIVVRRADNTISALVNRCVHKGSIICFQSKGKRERTHNFVCPYHNWIYDFDGNLTAIAFEKGIQQKGGMPPEFDKSQHKLIRLRVECIRGLIFGTFSEETLPLREYLGPVMVEHIERTIYGKIKLLGRYSQLMHNNWKLYIENSRDNYHPSLLHAFFSTFKINRLSADGGTKQDERSWHHITFTKRFTDKGDAVYDSGMIRAQKEDYGLKDPSLIDQWMEYPDQITSCIQSIFPGFVLHQILNSLATRQIVTRGPTQCELVWTLFGFEQDTEEQTYVRNKQSNLVGPAGLVSMEDGMIGGFVQKGIAGDLDNVALLEMGGTGVGSQPTRATETSVRGFWKRYRELLNV